MLFRFCNLCYRDISVPIANLRKYGKKVAVSRPMRREFDEFEDDKPIVNKKKTPIITCKRPMFNFYKGQVYSKFEPVPLASKGWHNSKSKGDYFYIYPKEDCQKDITEIEELKFENYNLHPMLCERLQDLEFTEPLEIQQNAIPKILSGMNTILAAETGCGKTLAYLLPLLSQIIEWKPSLERKLNSPIGLIVTPSRELAVQIGLEAKRLTNNLGINTQILTGGRTKRMVSRLPMYDVDLVVASFGVISKLTTMKVYKLHNVRHIVLDEADALFDETFEEKLKVFMNRLPIANQQTYDENGIPKNVQLTLASATMPQRTSQVLGDIVNVDSLVQIVSEKLHHILVLQKFVRLGKSQKPYELLKYIKPKVNSRQPVIVFTNDNATCDWLSMFLHECNIDNVNLNGALPLKIRQGKYAHFRSGRVNVLATTNIGSRGLDTLLAQHVLNYDFPLDTSDYIHRCGRVGRVGSPLDCRVTNFISRPIEIEMVKKIERAVRRGKPIPIVNITKRGIEEEPEPDPAMSFDSMPEHLIEDLEEKDSIPY